MIIWNLIKENEQGFWLETMIMWNIIKKIMVVNEKIWLWWNITTRMMSMAVGEQIQLCETEKHESLTN